MNEDTKFVRAFFAVMSGLLFWVPVIYSLVTHRWLTLGLIFSTTIGLAVSIAIKNTK